MFGLTFEKLLVIGVIAAFIIGPERLPQAAEKLREFVRWARGAAGGAKEKLREELGDEFDDVDWRKLDPRQYDPRRIIKEALLEDLSVPPRVSAPTGAPITPNANANAAAALPSSIGAGAPGDIAGPAVAAGLAGGAGASAIGLAAAVADGHLDGPIDTLAAGDATVVFATPFDPEAT